MNPNVSNDFNMHWYLHLSNQVNRACNLSSEYIQEHENTKQIHLLQYPALQCSNIYAIHTTYKTAWSNYILMCPFQPTGLHIYRRMSHWQKYMCKKGSIGYSKCLTPCYVGQACNWHAHRKELKEADRQGVIKFYF